MIIKMRKISFLALLGLATLVKASWGEVGLERLIADFGWRGLLIGTFYKFVLPAFFNFYDSLPQVIIINPPLYHSLIFNPLSFFIKILEPLYVLAILSLGFYLILASGSPQGRAKAKALLPKLIISMVLVTLSPYLLKLLLSASREFSQDLLNLSPARNIFLETFLGLTQHFANKAALSLSSSYIFLVASLLLTFGIFVTIALRYLLLTLFLILFPLALFLYFLDFSKGLGRKILEQTFIWSFTQGIIALIFVGSNLGITILNLTGNLKILAGVSASFLLIISPSILFILVRRFLP